MHHLTGMIFLSTLLAEASVRSISSFFFRFGLISQRFSPDDCSVMYDVLRILHLDLGHEAMSRNMYNQNQNPLFEMKMGNNKDF